MIKRRKLTFISAVVSLICLFASSAAPIPLYSTYQRSINLTKGEVSLTAVYYFIGCILSLLILSKLGNSLGRRKTSLLALTFGIIGLVLLLVMFSSTFLMFARFFQGLSCGLGSAILSVYLLESGNEEYPNLAKAMVASAVFIGLAAGSLLSGTLVQLVPNYPLGYIVILVVMILCFVGISMSEEAGERRAFTIKSILPHLEVPSEVRRYFPAACCIFVGTWAMGGYFQAFSSTISVNVFNNNSTIVAGLILSLFMVPNFFGARLSSRFSNEVAQKYGMIFFAIFVIMMQVAFYLSSLVLFLIVSILAGVSQGVCSASAMNVLQSRVNSEKKTDLMSVVYIVSYGGAAIPNFVVSRLTNVLSFGTISFCYCVIVVVMCLGTVTFYKN